MLNIQRDPDGYLVNLADWQPEIALTIAAEDNVNLTAEHWLVINCLRDFYNKYQTTPSMRALITSLNQEQLNNFTSIKLQQLFSGGPIVQAAKFAGLPKPGKCM